MAYLDGATIALPEAERYLPALLDFCQGLSEFFSFTSATLLLDPPSTKRPVHSAEGDMFVIQLMGPQDVMLVRSVQGLPMTAPRPTPLFKGELGCGDVLFVPQGLDCRANGSATEPVIALALTVQTPEQALGPSLSMYMNDMLRQKLSAETDGFLRSAVTRHTRATFDATETSRNSYDERMRASAAELASSLSAAGLRAHFEDRMAKMRQAQGESAAKLVQTARQTPLPRNFVTCSSCLQVARGVSLKCTPGDSAAHFKRGTETLSLPIEATASYMLNELSDGAPHELSSLTCADPVERLCVAQVLVFKECIEVHSEAVRSRGLASVSETDPAHAYAGEQDSRSYDW